MSSPVPPPPGAARPLRILVCDDSVDGARTMALWLETLRHQVRVVHNGPEALAAAAGSRSGHRASISCSRCRRWPRASARANQRDAHADRNAVDAAADRSTMTPSGLRGEARIHESATGQPVDGERRDHATDPQEDQVPPVRRAVVVAQVLRQVLEQPLLGLVNALEEAPREERDDEREHDPRQGFRRRFGDHRFILLTSPA